MPNSFWKGFGYLERVHQDKINNTPQPVSEVGYEQGPLAVPGYEVLRIVLTSTFWCQFQNHC